MKRLKSNLIPYRRAKANCLLQELFEYKRTHVMLVAKYKVDYDIWLISMGLSSDVFVRHLHDHYMFDELRACSWKRHYITRVNFCLEDHLPRIKDQLYIVL